MQDLLVNEAVAAADALSSATLYALLQALLGSTPAALARSTVRRLPGCVHNVALLQRCACTYFGSVPDALLLLAACLC